MTDGYLDTNIFLRHITQDHAQHSPRASALFTRIEAREIELRTSEPVIFEVVFTLQSLYKAQREQIRDSVLPLIELSEIDLPNKRLFRRVFEIYTTTSLSFVDSYNVSIMEHQNEVVLYSFDHGYDKLGARSNIHRVEPP